VSLRSFLAWLVIVALMLDLVVPLARAAAATPEELEAQLKALQQQVDTLRRQIESSRTAAQPPATPPAPAGTTETPGTGRIERLASIADFKLGGYGSTRFEASDLDRLNESFTFRRFVLTGDATIGGRLRGLFELELERLTELEVERRAPSEGGRRGFQQSIEGSDKSEISLEQAWVEFALADWLKYRAGMMLVPVGRFNLNHDDNRWDLPRRSLVDRGTPVLPVPAAWSEVGTGFVGDVKTERWGTFGYEALVMNGVTLDSSIETIARGSSELETEVEITPRRGTANLDLKRDKAGAVRLTWSPAPGHELGASAYYGRYTPDFLPSEALWSIAFDGKTTLGPFELEGQYVRTHFNNIRRVARGFADAVAEREFSSGTPLDVVVEFELAGLAETKQGYWLDLRYRFFPDVLRDSLLGRGLDNPQFIVTLRGEQVWLDGLVSEVDFTNGQLTGFLQDNRHVNRVTLGLAYRPVPLVVFQTAFERTWTDRARSLAAVTNFLPARRSEDTANTFLFGVAFGF
jgi:hypothetical protein